MAKEKCKKQKPIALRLLVAIFGLIISPNGINRAYTVGNDYGSPEDPGRKQWHSCPPDRISIIQRL